jgi:hypothetical protein
MTTVLEQRIASFAKWRAGMISGIEFYKSWLDANGIADIQQSVRIYDLIESLKHDRMTLAFIAELSRGKTELINAMLFGHCKRRVLPSDVGRTTMCPTEIFHDPSQPPYVRLLPIETRRRNETVTALKRSPVEWIKVDFDPASETSLIEALKSLVQTKSVSKQDAMALGLYDHAAAEVTTLKLSDPAEVEIPAWRHALVNYPHPLLTGGLTVLDTPGLNALGTEPELTMSMIPNAHAAVFMLAVDTGVTRSDMEVWKTHIAPRVPRRLAVLNKIDLLWDDIKTEEEIATTIDRQVQSTASLLGLPTASVLPVSAQKALAARIRGDGGLLAASGIERFEHLLAEEIIPAKQEIMRTAIEHELGVMVETSRQVIVTQFNAARAEHQNLIDLTGKNKSVAQAMLTRLENDRANLELMAARFNASAVQMRQRGEALLRNLSAEALDQLLNTDRQYIEGAWSTAGLIKNMEGLFEHFTAQSNRLARYSNELMELVEGTYTHFHEKAGFERLSSPALNLEKHALAMHQLKEATAEFCHHPKQILTEKHWLVPIFYSSMVAEARDIFELTRNDAQRWLRNALNPLGATIKEHESQLARRVENLHKLKNNLHLADARLRQIEQQMHTIKQQYERLLDIKKNMATPSAHANPHVVGGESAPANDAAHAHAA